MQFFYKKQIEAGALTYIVYEGDPKTTTYQKSGAQLDLMIEAIYSLRGESDADPFARAIRELDVGGSGSLEDRFDRGFQILIPKRTDYDRDRVMAQIEAFSGLSLPDSPGVKVGRVLFNDPLVRRRLNQPEQPERNLTFQVKFTAAHADHFHVDVVLEPQLDISTALTPTLASALLDGWLGMIGATDNVFQSDGLTNSLPIVDRKLGDLVGGSSLLRTRVYDVMSGYFASPGSASAVGLPSSLEPV